MMFAIEIGLAILQWVPFLVPLWALALLDEQGWTENYHTSILFDSLLRDSKRMNQGELTYVSYLTVPCISLLLFSGLQFFLILV